MMRVLIRRALDSCLSSPGSDGRCATRNLLVVLVVSGLTATILVAIVPYYATHAVLLSGNGTSSSSSSSSSAGCGETEPFVRTATRRHRKNMSKIFSSRTKRIEKQENGDNIEDSQLVSALHLSPLPLEEEGRQESRTHAARRDLAVKAGKNRRNALVNRRLQKCKNKCRIWGIDGVRIQCVGACVTKGQCRNKCKRKQYVKRSKKGKRRKKKMKMCVQVCYIGTNQGTGANKKPPTGSPTDAPTEAPTDVPTEAPTDVPTEAPTDVPTEAPTDVPTQPPTEPPTSEPTEPTTEPPTDLPT